MLSLTILGNNSAIPAFGRHPTAQVLQTDNENFLIDCGEGTQTQLTKYKIRRSKINAIFISHLHGDHYFGLIGLITSMGLLGRTQDLHLYAPQALQQIIELQLNVADTKLPFPLHFHSICNEGILYENSKITVSCFSVKHRIECWGFLFKEKKKPKKINIERATSYEIPKAFYSKLQQGHDYVTKKGTIIPNAEVTNENTKPKSYAYCADTIFDTKLIEKVKNVDLLYHETTYLKDLEERAASRYHSTTHQAATIAKLSNAKKLIVGHFSSKYETIDDFLIEVQEVFENSELGVEGCCYRV